MLTFTVLLDGTGQPYSSIVITHPHRVAAGTLLALGVSEAGPSDLPDLDRQALRTREALSIPLADWLYYIDADDHSGRLHRLLQAHYALQDASEDTWPILSALLPRTRSIVLFASPTDDLDEEVLNPLLIRMRQLGVSPSSFRLTICIPTKQALLCSQRQMIEALGDGLTLTPRFFGVKTTDREMLGDVFRRACPNFWHMVQGELGTARLVSCALGRADGTESPGPKAAFGENTWHRCVVLPPHRIIQMAYSRDIDGLLAYCAEQEQRHLALSTLMRVALHSNNSAPRVAALGVWNQVDGEIGTDWLLSFLADDDPEVCQAAMDALCDRLPKALGRLIDMALANTDQGRRAREVLVRKANGQMTRLLIGALDDSEPSRRRIARHTLGRLGTRSWSALTARMQDGAYRGRIGAASVLARSGDAGAQQFLQSEFRHSRPNSERRRILREGFEAWDPQRFRRLVQEETEHNNSARAERQAGARRLVAGGGFGSVLGAIIFAATSFVIVGDAMAAIELNRWYGVSTNPTVLGIVSVVCGALTGLFGSMDEDIGVAGGCLGVGSGLASGLIIGVAIQIDGVIQFEDNPFMAMMLFALYVLSLTKICGSSHVQAASANALHSGTSRGIEQGP